MITVNDSLISIAEFRAVLADGNLAVVDLDRLASFLAELTPLLHQTLSFETDLQLLREDCISRITGMAKAIAAARPTADTYPQTVEFLDALPSFTSAQLLETHRRVSARFRDTFPTSYGRPFDRSTH